MYPEIAGLECSCGHRPPFCERCFRSTVFYLSSTAGVRGANWGERLWRSRQAGRLAGEWPAWGTERAANVMRKCRELVGDIASGDERTAEALAQVAADAARVVYGRGPVIPGVVAFHNRKPGA